ncbi:MAG: hypothetical protein QW579_04040 [Desulfurococcaceae archaeon]
MSLVSEYRCRKSVGSVDEVIDAAINGEPGVCYETLVKWGRSAATFRIRSFIEEYGMGVKVILFTRAGEKQLASILNLTLIRREEDRGKIQALQEILDNLVKQLSKRNFFSGEPGLAWVTWGICWTPPCE